MNMRRLAELPLFAGLDDDALREIGAAVTEESVEAGRLIVREGDYSQASRSSTRAPRASSATVEHLATLGPGDTFGEQGLLAKTQRNATVVAVDDMRLIHMTKFDLNRIKGAHPEFVDADRPDRGGAGGLARPAGSAGTGRDAGSACAARQPAGIEQPHAPHAIRSRVPPRPTPVPRTCRRRRSRTADHCPVLAQRGQARAGTLPGDVRRISQATRLRFGIPPTSARSRLPPREHPVFRDVLSWLICARIPVLRGPGLAPR